MRVSCAFCGCEFDRRYPWQIFCCNEHAYKADNLRRKMRRANRIPEHPMPDVWGEGRLPACITANRLNYEWAAVPGASDDILSPKQEDRDEL